MFIRKVKNRFGSQSVQVIQKFRGKYKVVKTIGCATTQHEIERLEQLSGEEMNRLSGNQTKLFGYESDERFEQVFFSASQWQYSYCWSGVDFRQDLRLYWF